MLDPWWRFVTAISKLRSCTCFRPLFFLESSQISNRPDLFIAGYFCLIFSLLEKSRWKVWAASYNGVHLINKKYGTLLSEKWFRWTYHSHNFFSIFLILYHVGSSQFTADSHSSLLLYWYRSHYIGHIFMIHDTFLCCTRLVPIPCWCTRAYS